MDFKTPLGHGRRWMAGLPLTALTALAALVAAGFGLALGSAPVALLIAGLTAAPKDVAHPDKLFARPVVTVAPERRAASAGVGMQLASDEEQPKVAR
jgi:hypothetical protein